MLEVETRSSFQSIRASALVPVLVPLPVTPSQRLLSWLKCQIIKMVKMLTQMKTMYKPKIKRSMMALIIFHSCEDLLSWKWLSICRRMAARSLASFFSSVRLMSSWGLTDGSSELLWRSLEEMMVGAGSAQTTTHHGNR